MDYEGMSDRTILLLLAERSERTDAALWGEAGRDGLVQTSARYDERISTLEREQPSAARRRLESGGIISALLAAVTALAAALGKTV